MGEKQQQGFWRKARRLFRWCRIGVWLVLLAVLLALIYLDRVGLPEFAKERLVAVLRERGMDLEFTRMRLVWYRGVVADNVQFGRFTDPRAALRGAANQAELHLRLRSMLMGRLDIEGIALRGGHVILPVWGTNETPRELTFEKVSGELKFLPQDRWELNGLRAEAFGVQLMLGGTVTNASYIRHWKFGQERPRARTPEAFWHDLVTAIERTHFTSPTEIIGTVSGDARHMGTFRANLVVNSPRIDSPWGKGSDLKLTAQIDPEPGQLIHAAIKLEAQNADTPWGRAESIQLDGQVTPSLTQWTPTNALLNLNVRRARSHWANAASLSIKASFRPNPSDAASSLADYLVRGQQIQTPWARFAQAELNAEGVVSSSNAWPRTTKALLRFAGGNISFGHAASGTLQAELTLPPLDAMQFGNTNVPWWTRLEQIAGSVSARLVDVRSDHIDADVLALKSTWAAPALVVNEIDAQLYGGKMEGSAKFDTVASRLTAEIKSDLDPRHATNLFTTNVLQRLGGLAWKTPPDFQIAAGITLPPWTNGAAWKNADWAGEVLATFDATGRFQVGPASFRGIEITGAQSDFTFTNRSWHLPNLQIARPEGRVHVAHSGRLADRHFQFIIDSTADLRALRPVMNKIAHPYIDDFEITTPPAIHAEFSGWWDQPEKISAYATVTASNVSYRAQPVQSVNTGVTFTNLVLSFIDPRVVRSEGSARADSVIVHVPEKRVYINNATGALHAASVTKAILPVVERITAPYRFIEAPGARVHGIIDWEDEWRSNLRFELAGGPFEWRHFRFQQITGVVHWNGRYVTLSNIVGSMNGGLLRGSMMLDCGAPRGADFSFQTMVHDINLQSLVRDLGATNSKLEGTLAGLLVITNANTEDLNSWFGHGSMMLQDGLIWDVPVFGLFSPILNSIKPGAGNNRAKEATATFIVTNSVFYTSDLRINASGMRLNYNGTVDFDTRIDGRMEAELFRDTPGVGLVVSKVFWPVTKLFEYKVTGTFGKPKAEPLYIPKVLMMPFHPLRTLRELIEGDREEPFR